MAGNKIELSEAIKDLRAQLVAAITEGADKELRFGLGTVELEFNAVVERGKSGEVGVKWYLFSAGGKAEESASVTQKIKLQLSPPSGQLIGSKKRGT